MWDILSQRHVWKFHTSTWDVTQWYLRYDSFMCVTWLMTHMTQTRILFSKFARFWSVSRELSELKLQCEWQWYIHYTHVCTQYKYYVRTYVYTSMTLQWLHLCSHKYKFHNICTVYIHINNVQTIYNALSYLCVHKYIKLCSSACVYNIIYLVLVNALFDWTEWVLFGLA